MNAWTHRLLTSSLRFRAPILFSPNCLRPSRPLRFHLQKNSFSSRRSSISTQDTERLEAALVLEQLNAEAKRPISLRPLLVGVGICVGAFLVAEALDAREDARFFAILRQRGWRDGNLARAKRFVAEVELEQMLNGVGQIPGTQVARDFYYTLQKWWIGLDGGSDGTRATGLLICCNAVVFLGFNLASRSPKALSLLQKYFVHFPGHSASYTLLTSVFGHRTFWHFSFNMLALYSFGPTCFNYLQAARMRNYPNIDESLSNGQVMNVNSTYHNIAFFITCGIVSNLIPHYISLLALRSPMLMNSTAAPALIPRPGLGASGAIWSCLAVGGLYDPSTQISLIFLPMVPFSIGYGLSGMALLDAFGVLRGWHTFGHMQHLTGAAVGVAAYFYGPAAWYWGQWTVRRGKIS